MEYLRQKIENIPDRPGAYIFKDKGGTVLYIGKAKSLKNRLRSYLMDTAHPRLREILRKSKDVDIFVTESEGEALLLEANLIKRYLPRYNVKLKDDKKYPYIKVTVNEKFPRVFATRDLREDDSLLFGPYTHAAALRKAIRTVRKIFPIRTCKYKLPSKRIIHPCIDYHIGKCIGPCFKEIEEKEYKKIVDGVVDFLSGKTNVIEKRLEDEMNRAALNLAFEKAAKIRDQLFAIRELISGERVISQSKDNKDLVAFSKSGNLAMALILIIREGKVVGKDNFLLDIPTDVSDSELVTSFIAQYYTTSTVIADEILVSTIPENKEIIEKILQERAGRKIKLRVISPKDKKLYELAIINAERSLEEELILRGKREERVNPALLELRDLFRLKKIPMRIEAIDISQLFGNHAVGSVVVFENGRPKKSLYRRYRIKTVEKIDDYAMMEEVIARRVKRLLEEKEKFPDVLLIDGGKGQLGIARKVLKKWGVKDVFIAAIAKRFDELHLEDGRVLMLPKRSSTLKLLQRIRNEAHRFALSYHRNLRGRSSLTSVLDNLPGIGETKKQAIIEYFGSIKRLLSASPEEISRVKGIGPKLAQKIYDILHGY